MPKYSVDEVLDIIQSLTPDEKNELQNRLSQVLNHSPSPANPGQSQGQTLSGIQVGSGSSFGVNQSIGGDVNFSQTTHPNQGYQGQDNSLPLHEVLRLLQGLKQDVLSTEALNTLEQKSTAATIEVLEEEIQKPKPDPGLIEQAIAALEKGLKGVEKLAEPTLRVAKLVAAAWLC